MIFKLYFIVDKKAIILSILKDGFLEMIL